MPRTVRPLILLLAVTLSLGLIAAACGGGGGDDPTATATAAATDPAEATATEPEVDLGISGRIEGDFVAPDSHAFDQRFQFGGLSFEQSVVIIGDDAWIREGDEQWRMTSASDPEVLDTLDLTSADVEFIDNTELAEGLAALDSEPEEINGVATRRYFIPAEAVETLIDIFGDDFLAGSEGLESFEMTVWLHEETGGLIRAELVALAAGDVLGDFPAPGGSSVQVSIRIDRTRINDPDIVIEPPTDDPASPGTGATDRPFESYHYTVDLEVAVQE